MDDIRIYSNNKQSNKQSKTAKHKYVGGSWVAPSSMPITVDGTGYPEYALLSDAQYSAYFDNFLATMYSDHAPVIYSINPHLKLITWNIACFGDSEYFIGTSKPTCDATQKREAQRASNIFPNVAGMTCALRGDNCSYNHKFNALAIEEPLNYIKRLSNIAYALYSLLSNVKYSSHTNSNSSVKPQPLHGTTP